jgi:hypothetical protein
MNVAAGLRYEGPHARRGHVESWFLKANDPASRRAIWLKWTLWAGDRAPGTAVAEAWAIAFGTKDGHVATKLAVPYGSGATGGPAHFDRDGLGVSVDGCTLSASAARGRVEAGGRVVAFDLAIDALAGPLFHFPGAWMYNDRFPAQKITSPIPDARFSGRIAVGEGSGEVWSVDRWPGMIGHNWGHQHSPLYAWGQCNVWDGGEDLVLEGASVGGGGPVLGATVLSVRHDGVRQDLNGILSLARNGGAITPRRWRFRGRARNVAVDGEMWADTDDFVGLFYPNPDGTRCHCLNSKLARAEVTLRVGDGAPRMFRSSRAALEIGTTDPHHGVRMYL